MLKKVAKTGIALLLAIFIFIGATAASLPGLQKFTLDNGLDVFVVENHIVPLVTTMIAFRCGAYTSREDTAGLFHLYEHMLFKGNEKFKNQTEFSAAMKNIGVATWNGGTSSEYVNYYFTIPSDKLSEGLEFWAAAAKSPLFEKGELEREKKVVINEIKGYHNTDVFRAATNKYLYYKYPYRRDISGPVRNIENADYELMREIQHTYYVPNNAAVFISGDVNPKEALALAKEHFGDWEPSYKKDEIKVERHPYLKENKNIVYNDPMMHPQLTVMRLLFRGPDVDIDPEATFAADVWGTLIGMPNNKFKEAIHKAVPGLHPRGAGYYYWTQRDGGQIIFSDYMLNSPNQASAMLSYREAVMAELEKMANDPDYFSVEDIEYAKRKLQDDQIVDMDDPSNFVSSLSFWWASASADYYLDYIENCKEVTSEDITNYVKKYLIGKKSLLALDTNKNAFNANKEALLKDFINISKQNAYWWAEK